MVVVSWVTIRMNDSYFGRATAHWQRRLQHVADRKIATITGPQFASGFALRPQNHAWFLGAGASATAGIPTGYMMVRDFKTRLFCREANLPRREVDSTDPLWEARIEQFFRTRALLPPSGDPTEYAKAFEAVFPNEDQRRQYIEDAIRKGTPCFAHRVVASLLSDKRIPCVFTTNFDPLVETACTVTDQLLPAELRAHVTVAALDSVDRAVRCLRESDWPLVAKLHGDYKSTDLKNTEGELEHQDQQMRTVLTGACQRFGLIVVGYSGRDASVMEALEAALKTENSYPGGLYWVARSGKNLLPAVQELLQRATAAGVNVSVVESQTFDELAADILNQFALPKVLHEHVFSFKDMEPARPAPLPTVHARKFPVLRCAALPVEELPSVARRLTLTTNASTKTVRDLLKATKVHAAVACNGREVAAFGHDAQLLSALATLGARLDGTIELRPEVDSWATGLLYDALARGLCRGRPLLNRLRRSGHFLLVATGRPDESSERARERGQRLARLQNAYESPLSGVVPTLNLPYSEGLRIRLEQCVGKWWCVFDPFTHIDFPREHNQQMAQVESEDPAGPFALGLRRGDPAGDWRRERWARKYNKQWTNIIGAWSELLSSTEDNQVRAFGVPSEAGVDAIFRVSDVTAWSRPAHQHPYFERTK